MQKYADVVLDRKGNVVPSASVRVKTQAGTDAVLYSANNAGSISNPVTTDSLGRFAFYAANGRYNLQVYIGSALFTVSNDILLEDPQDASPELIEGGTFRNGALENVTIDGVSPAILMAWAYAQTFQVVSATRDANSAITTATIIWPDGTAGVFTTDVASTAFPGAIDAWHATYASTPSKLITQPTVTRDANGAVIAQPAITIV